MSEPNPFDPFFEKIREIVRDQIKAILGNGQANEELLSPEELAKRLHMPVSWVYEQSRLNKIPTHRIGRYIRFSVAEVLESQKKK